MCFKCNHINETIEEEKKKVTLVDSQHKFQVHVENCNSLLRHPTQLLHTLRAFKDGMNSTAEFLMYDGKKSFNILDQFMFSSIYKFFWNRMVG